MDLAEVEKDFNNAPYKHHLFNFSVDEKKYQLQYKRSDVRNKNFTPFTAGHPTLRELDILQRDNNLDAKCMMYMRQGLMHAMTMEEAYCYYLDRMKPLHPKLYERKHKHSIRKGRCPPHVKNYDFSV